MFGWVAVQLSVASGRDALVDAYGNGRGTRDDALFGPGTGAVLTSVMMNVLFFVTAVATGLAATLLLELGVTRMVECWGEDVPRGTVTDMFRAVQAGEDEAVLFS